MFLTKLRWVLAAVAVAMGVTNAWSQTPKPDLKSTPGLSDAFARAVRGFDKTPRGSYFASQPSQGYQAGLSTKGALTLSTGKTRFGVSVTAFGRGAQRGQLGETTVKSGKDLAGWPQLSFNRSQISEWYVNEQSGLHHWLRVEKRPAATGNLWVRLGVTGDVNLKSISDTAVEVHGQSTVLTYGGLKVWDSRGKVLPARLEVERQNIHLVVQDSTAVYPVTIDPIWTEESKLIAPDPSLNDLFGYSVAIEGDLALVGARENSVGGAVYVFSRSTAGEWTWQTKLIPSTIGNDHRFGCSVSLSQGKALVGAWESDAGGAGKTGAAFVFSRSPEGVWAQEAVLTPADGGVGDQFGLSVSLSQDTALVGSRLNSPGGVTFAGAAYVFKRNQSGTWSQQAKLTANDLAEQDYFGYAISLDQGRAIIGSFAASPGSVTYAGAAYIFARGEDGGWFQEAKLVASDKQEFDRMGTSVSLSGNRALVGAYSASPSGVKEAGAAYIFFRSTAGVWNQEAKLTASDKAESDYFGLSVSLVGDRALVGAGGCAIGGLTDAGAAYMFTRSSGSWAQTAKLCSADPTLSAYFGWSVCLGDDIALIGAMWAEAGDTAYAGAAYVFSFSGHLAINFLSHMLPVGDAVVGTVTSDGAAPSGGLDVFLNTNSPALTVPATVTIPQGATSVTFTATANSVTTDTPVTVTASSPGYDNGTATVTVQPRIEASEFVSQSVQNSYYATNQHPVSVTMKNTGTTTWTRTTHRLVAMNPFNNTTWGRNDVLIPTGVSIAPGQSHTFAFNITAPTAAGNYNFQWQMRKVSPGVPTNFGQTSTNVLVSVLTGFNAEFFSQAVPTALEPGKKVDVQVVMRNRGSTTWTPDNVRLISKTTPTNLFGKDSIQLLPGETIAPGQYKTFNFRIQAPAAEGDYAFKWQMRRLGVANFGPETPTVSIHVQALYNSQFVSQSVPSTMQTANSYPVSVTFTNTGTATWAPGQYILYSQNAPGNNRWRVNSVPLPSSVAPGASVTFSFTVYAPLTPGSYNFQWRLRKSGTGDFGALSTNVPVVVNN
jgi:hypothetical protein